MWAVAFIIIPFYFGCYFCHCGTAGSQGVRTHNYQSVIRGARTTITKVGPGLQLPECD